MVAHYSYGWNAEFNRSGGFRMVVEMLSLIDLVVLEQKLVQIVKT